MSFQRARTEEQREERRTDILESAAALLHESGIEGTSLNGIARRAGIAKSGVYNYFESREEIFLHLFLDDFESLVDWAVEALKPLEGSNDPRRIAAVMAQGLGERPRFCELNAALAPVLEQNVSEETVFEFKSAILGQALRLGLAVHDAIPEIEFEPLARAMGPLYALIGGLWPSANPPPAVAAVLARPEFELMRHDFGADLARGIELILRGLLAEA
jgi:AcrR family transcriptional regulator